MLLPSHASYPRLTLHFSPPVSDRPARVVGRIIKVQELVLQEVRCRQPPPPSATLTQGAVLQGWSAPHPDLQLGDKFALLLATDVRPYSEDDGTA